MKEIKEKGIAPLLFSFAAGFIVCLAGWLAWTVMTTGTTATSGEPKMTKAKAIAELERGVEIEGEDALKDAATQVSLGVGVEQSDYLDERRLDEKFMEINQDYLWESVREDLDRTDDSKLVRISADELLNAQPGTILTQGNSMDGSDTFYDYVVSVPVIKQDGSRAHRLDQYGAIQIFSYYTEVGQFEFIHANCELYLFDKQIFKEGHDLTIDAEGAWVFSTPYVIGPGDFLSFSVSTPDGDYDKEELLAREIYTAGRADGSFCGSSWSYDMPEAIKKTAFSKTSIDLNGAVLDAILEKAEVTGALSKYTPEELYNEDRSKFDLDALLSSETGILGGTYEFQSGYNGWFFVKSLNDHYVVAVKENEIYIGGAAVPLSPDIDADVERDKLYIGKYYEDQAVNPKMIEIDYCQVTQNTLEQLLYLLMDSGVNWANIGPIPDYQ